MRDVEHVTRRGTDPRLPPRPSSRRESEIRARKIARRVVVSDENRPSRMNAVPVAGLTAGVSSIVGRAVYFHSRAVHSKESGIHFEKISLSRTVPWHGRRARCSRSHHARTGRSFRNRKSNMRLPRNVLGSGLSLILTLAGTPAPPPHESLEQELLRQAPQILKSLHERGVRFTAETDPPAGRRRRELRAHTAACSTPAM